MEVKLIDRMGNDLSVVNAARVSFAKVHEQFDEKNDTGLINYLAKHNHSVMLPCNFISRPPYLSQDN
jgi:hypothetical protein